MADDGNIIEFRKAIKGRPRFQFTPEIEEFILMGIVAGLSLRQIEEEGLAHYGQKAFPSRAVIKVHLASTPAFQASYIRAKDVAQDLMAEDLIDIIDGRHPGFEQADLGQRKESAEIRKWVMGKLRRKKWGDVKVTEIVGKDGEALMPQQTIDPRLLTPEVREALKLALTVAIKGEAAEAKFNEEEPDGET
jgi:hypothetical protein